MTQKFEWNGLFIFLGIYFTTVCRCMSTRAIITNIKVMYAIYV